MLTFPCSGRELKCDLKWEGEAWTCDLRLDSQKEKIYIEIYWRVGFWGESEDGKLQNCWDRNITY